MQFGLITTIKEVKRERLARILSVVGGIVVLAGVVWVGIQGFRVLPNASQMLGSALVSVQSFFSPAERIVVSLVDSQVVLNEPFTLTWEHRGKESDGSYTFFYECRDGVHLARTVQGSTDTAFCNTELPLLSTDTTLSLTARGTLAGMAQIPVEVRFYENNDSAVSERGELTVLVQDVRFDDGVATSTTPISTTGETPTTPTTPVTTGTTRPTPGTGPIQTIPVVTGPTSDPNGKPDLVVRVLAYGLVDRNTGEFDERDEIPQDLPSGKRGAIRFEVENIGTKVSDEWQFEAALPTSPSYTFTSKDQQSLFPGDKIEFIIGFDRIRNTTEDDYSIEVDPDDDVDESNERNNTESGMIEIDR